MFTYERQFIVSEDLAHDMVEIPSGENAYVDIPLYATYKIGVDAESGQNHITAFQEAAPVAEVLPSVTFTWGSTNKDHKIDLKIRLRRATYSAYANTMWSDSIRSFITEVPANASLDQAVKFIQDSLMLDGVPELKVEKVSTTGIKITGTSATQAFHEARMGIRKDGAAQYEDQWTWSAPSAQVAGVLPVGDYKYLMENVTLPTTENMSYFGVGQYNLPIKGKSYKRFAFLYNSGLRDIGGSGVVANRANSYTSHIFWVETSLAANANSQIMKALNLIKTNAPTPAPTPPAEDKTGN